MHMQVKKGVVVVHVKHVLALNVENVLIARIRKNMVVQESLNNHAKDGTVLI